ncbi:DUF2267 domain-containing protein [Actinacidiphila paucisporea]|uniref:Uncharacterized conserved protein, DUF2267 family n=1 Tax=Actinacidiphila paucisporea TaxID=310782 RepID=A0A1M7PKS7_9ACTN|nr:DUF2267 domain-containing protein [Actinacidiphila paucisporea]SHN17564.1 Uncharacterized conserved protein, DUF2267 family [Actinacidiphila paucisporea]
MPTPVPTQPGRRRNAPAPSYDQTLERIRYDGAYPTRERAEQVTRTVLAALAAQLGGDLRAELAAQLPAEAARPLHCAAPAAQPLTGWGFVQDVAARSGTSPAVARWDTGAVLGAVAALADPGLLTRILDELPSGYALLFGRAELVQAA